MNKSVIGVAIVAMALLPSFASAASTPYAVAAGMIEPYQVDGVENVEPTLDPSAGTARILSPVFALGKWSFSIECQSTVNCAGDILH